MKSYIECSCGCGCDLFVANSEEPCYGNVTVEDSYWTGEDENYIHLCEGHRLAYEFPPKLYLLESKSGEFKVDTARKLP